MKKTLKQIVKLAAFQLFETALLALALFPTSNALIQIICDKFTILERLMLVLLFR